MTISNDNYIRLGGSDLVVSRLGIGAMTWSDSCINIYSLGFRSGNSQSYKLEILTED